MTAANTTTSAPQRSLQQAIRALAHDAGATLMVLDHSLRQLKRLLKPSDAGAIAPNSSPPVATQIAHVEACLQALGCHLSELTELARQGSFETPAGLVRMSEVVEEVLFEQCELIASRGVDVAVRGTLATCWCNRRRLKQIVTNLVRNAVLHGGDPAGPRLIISSPTDSPAGAASVRREMAALRIFDNGPGIPAQHRETIFLPGHRFARRDVPGSGMGLAIVRRLAEECGGWVELDSRGQGGTVFVVWLPASADGAETRHTRSGHKRWLPVGKRRKLAIDANHRR